MAHVGKIKSYDTSGIDGGKKRAVNLQLQQGEGPSRKEQARAQ